jgi:eukaryotic-like serine/threonine-protein kinase
MSGDRSTNADPNDLEQARQIHSVCEEFECRWRAGERLPIEELIERVDHGGRPALLEELLTLELELRRGAGERPTLDEYRSRFPDAEGRVLAAFELAAGTSRTASEAETVLNGSATSDIYDTSAMGLTFGRIGDYDVVEEIARGGMGVVYKAKQRKANRLVALKMILSGQMASADERERFLREAELAANLDHQHIVPIYEVAEFQGCPYFSMKLIEGDSLSHQIKARKRSGTLHDPQTAARLMATIARAVQYAHECGFLHCYLKPSNILVDREGRPYVTDFGLAKRASEDSAMSLSGAIMGTPSYMAPEQASGSRKELRPTTDVYGLGAIFYELLTARPPLSAESVPETVVAVLERDPTPPRELRREVPHELETICLKCLEKSPQDRYASAASLADEIDRYLRGEVIDATTLIPRLRRWNRREPELVARLGGLLLVALISQINYHFISVNRSLWLHCQIQGVLALWAASAIVFQAMLRSGWRSDKVRVLWSAADIALLTVEVKLFEWLEADPDSGDSVVRFVTTLLVGYPLLIAASGLWWRVNLVWITTALAMFA